MSAAKEGKITISSFCKTCQTPIIAEIKINWGSDLLPRVQCPNCQEIFDVQLTDDEGYPFLSLLPIDKPISPNM